MICFNSDRFKRAQSNITNQYTSLDENATNLECARSKKFLAIDVRGSSRSLAWAVCLETEMGIIQMILHMG